MGTISTTGQNNVFTLGDVYSRELLGTWFHYEDIFISDTSRFGKPPWNKSYSVGGQSGYSPATPNQTMLSSVCRFDMDNDTALATPRANKTWGSSDAFFGSSQNYGYYMKGRRYNNDSVPSPNFHYYVEDLGSSAYEKLDYSNDTAQMTTVYDYWAAGTQQWCAGVSASTNDWTWMHGGLRWFTEDDTTTSNFNRFSHANDSLSLLGSGWQRAYATATNDGDHMYIIGGYSSTAGQPSYSMVIRYDLWSDTTDSSSDMNITPGGSKHTMAFGTPNYGYVMSGQFYGSPYNPKGVGNTIVYRLDYASDVATTTGGKLTHNRTGSRGFSNRDYGYISGGRSNWATTASPYADPAIPNVDKTDCERLTFASDTVNMIPRGSEPSTRILGRSLCSTNFYGAQFMTGYSVPGPGLNASDDYENKYEPYYERNMPVLLGKTSDGVYGVYVIGGQAGNPGSPGYGAISSVQRLDMLNDTGAWSTRANTVVGTCWENGGTGQGTSSVTHGYWGGGNTTGVSAGTVSTMQRIDYATETVSTDGTVFDSDVEQFGVTGNDNYGFWGGGKTGNSSPSDDPTSQIFRFEYSNSTRTTAGDLTIPRRLHGSGGNLNYGYHLGGAGGLFDTSGTSSVDRLDYSSYTSTCSPKATLPYSWSECMFVPLSPQHGIFGGGRTGPSPSGSLLNTDQLAHWKYQYGSDTVSLAIGAPTQLSVYDWKTGRGGAAGHHGTGYFMGGRNPASSPYAAGDAVATVRKIDPMTCTFNTPTNKSSLQQVADRHAALSVPTNVHNNFVYTNLYNAAFNVETGAKRTFNFGYVTSGRKYSAPSSPVPQLINSSTERIDYDNDTVATSPKGNNINVWRAASVGNQNYGYIGGGNSNPQPSSPDVLHSYIKRFDYSNDTANTSSPGANLSNDVRNLKGVSNTNYGYFVGGVTAGDVLLPVPNTIDRLDFSSDTSNATPKGSLPTSRALAGASGNQNYGWLFGGRLPAPSYSSLTDRMDYSNDTAATSPKSNVPTDIGDAAATGTKDKGYLMGGYDGTTNRNQILKYDYVNDSWTPSGTIDRYVMGNAATGSLTHGYSISGYAGMSQDTYTNVNRIDYSSDTDISVGKLTTGRNGHVAFGARENAFEPIVGLYEPENIPVQSESKFYSFGGALGNTSPYTTTSSTTSGIDRLDFKSGTFSKSTKADLLSDRSRHASCGNQNYTWTAGGCSDGNYYSNNSNNLTTVERFEYSNDTNKLTPAQLPSPGYRSISAQGNINYGYWSGGTEGENTDNENSQTYRVDYANDTVSTAARSAEQFGVATVGTQDYGWWGGGAYHWPGGGVLMREAIYKLTYANDTAIPGPGSMGYIDIDISGPTYSPVGVCDSVMCAIGIQDKTFGWYIGGCYGQGLNSPYYDYEDRLLNASMMIRHDLSNDTTTVYSNSKLARGTANGAGTSDDTYGYIIGGAPVPDFHTNPGGILNGGGWNSSVQRISLSNWTVYGDFKGTLGQNKGWQSAWNAQDACNYH